MNSTKVTINTIFSPDQDSWFAECFDSDSNRDIGCVSKFHKNETDAINDLSDLLESKGFDPSLIRTPESRSVSPTNEQKQIEEAERRKELAVVGLDRAYTLLCKAQNEISWVRGEGSPKIYDEIAGCYQQVSKLRDRLRNMEPTGLAE